MQNNLCEPSNAFTPLRSTKYFMGVSAKTQPTISSNYFQPESESVARHSAGGGFLSRTFFSPESSSLFLRTPFFSITHALDFRPSLQILDRYTSQITAERYLIFPQSNDVKASIFRRLNKQRQLFTGRLLRFKNLKPAPSNSFSGSPISQISSMGTPHVSRSGEVLSCLTNRGLVWSLFSCASQDTFITPRVKRIRFKPGYSRM
jgi:hypothetical protein